MSYEIDDNYYPNTAVVYITARWGTATYSGTGVLVGKNDVLTAAHVIYSPEFGRVADEIWIYPSYDPDDASNARFAPVYVQYFPDFDPDSDGYLITGDFYRTSYAGSEKDIALLTLTEDVGARYGYFGIDPYFGGGAVGVIGYPAYYGRQPMFDSGNVSRSGVDNTLYIDTNLEVNPGNSGGPVYYDYGNGPYLVGLVSTRIAATFIGGHWGWLQQALAANDSELGDVVPPTAHLSSEQSVLTEGETATIYIRTSEPTSDLTLADLSVSAGSLRNFTQIASTLYSVDYVPPANASTQAGIWLASGRFSDAAGNLNSDGADADNRVIFDIDTEPALHPLDGTRKADRITGSQFADLISGYAGNDRITAAGGVDIVYAGAGNDIVDGGDGGDFLLGGSGKDLLSGAAGDDEIDGGPGNDQLSGGTGDDVINGGAGRDALAGNSGTDWFVFSADSLREPVRKLGAADRDLLRDFTPHSDKLVFVAYDDNALGFEGLDAYWRGDALDPLAFIAGAGIRQASDADQRLLYDTRTGLLQYDADGRGGQSAIPLATLAGNPELDATDIYFIRLSLTD